MSLRTVHILFILTALGLMGFIAYWSRHNTAMLACAALGLAVGIPYLGWFIKKTKTL